VCVCVRVCVCVCVRVFCVDPDPYFSNSKLEALTPNSVSIIRADTIVFRISETI